MPNTQKKYLPRCWAEGESTKAFAGLKYPLQKKLAVQNILLFQRHFLGAMLIAWLMKPISSESYSAAVIGTMPTNGILWLPQQPAIFGEFSVLPWLSP